MEQGLSPNVKNIFSQHPVKSDDRSPGSRIPKSSTINVSLSSLENNRFRTSSRLKRRSPLSRMSRLLDILCSLKSGYHKTSTRNMSSKRQAHIFTVMSKLAPLREKDPEGLECQATIRSKICWLNDISDIHTADDGFVFVTDDRVWSVLRH